MSKSKKISTKMLVTLGLLTAVSIVLTRFCVIYLTETLRISFGNIPIIMAGIIFGPVAGALTGLAADLVGAVFLSGLGWYPPLTLTAILMGIIPGLMRRLIITKLSCPRIITVTVISNLIGTIVWSTLCLHWMYSSPILALIPVRLPFYICIAVMEAVIIFVLFKTGFFKEYGLKPLRGENRDGL